MKKYAILTAVALGLTLTSNATVWRVNNNTGVNADFTNLDGAIYSASVVSGDTVYIEPSASIQNPYNLSLSKRLVLIGNGYLLNGSANGNAGLQENVNESNIGTNSYNRLALDAGSEGSVFIGLTNIRLYFASISNPANILVERCKYPILTILNGPRSNVTIRKCYLWGTTVGSASIMLSDFILENNIFNGSVDISNAPGSTNNLFRNNTVNGTLTMNNVYVANNICLTSGQSTFTSCVVKNNVFVANQTGVTIGPLSTNGNNLVSQTRASLIVDTGSDDGKYQLAVTSPAIGGGVDISGVKPDCGAYGGNDPYGLSGIPNIPTIYSLSFPNGNSVPAGAPSILVDFSTRNNK